MSKRTLRLESFFKALLHHWGILLLSVLSLISTALTYLPNVHISKLLPIGIALAVIFIASYLVYSDKCDELESLQTRKSDAMVSLEKLRQNVTALQSDLVQMQQSNSALSETNESLTAANNDLQNEIKRLKVRPYDQQKLETTRQSVLDLPHYERDLLRLILMKGGSVRGDVIFLARSDGNEGLDINALTRPLEQSGFVTRIEDVHHGLATFTLPQGLVDVLKDILYPRDEGGLAPFFKGI